MQRRKAAAAKDEPARKAARRDTDAPTKTLFRLDTLHRDILSLVLAALPVPSRVHVAARVCKQWRALALASITALTLYGSKERKFDRALALLPSLTHVKLRSTRDYVPQAVHLPTTITSVVICADVRICAPLPTALTRLALRDGAGTPSSFSYRCFPTLLKASAATLQCLQIFDSVDLASLRNLHCPALTSLHLLYVSVDLDTDLSFLARHSSQLVRLELVQTPDLMELTRALSLPYPSLTSLCLPSFFTAITDDALKTSLISRITSLSAIPPTGPFCGDLSPFTRLHTIERLHASLLDDFKLLMQNLSRHNWLRMVRRLHFLTVRISIARPLLRACVNITKVSFFVEDSKALDIFPLLPGTSLPHVTKLNVSTRASTEVVKRFVCHLGHACPNVQHITAGMLKFLPDDFVTDVCDAYPALLVLKLLVETYGSDKWTQRSRDSVVQLVIEWRPNLYMYDW